MKNKLSVLVIDDDADVRGTICDSLLGQGFFVTEAENGQRGLDSIRTTQPDIVVTDIIMPEEEGLGVIRAVKKINAAIKIVAISGSYVRGMDKNSFLAMAQKLGADAVFPKPINMDDFEKTILSLSKH